MPADDSGGTIKLGATLVNIPVLVSDRSGRYVPRLTERDFSLYEDGTQQEIAFFGSEEVPFNVVLLLDMSPSVRNRAEDIQDAAIEFVRQLRRQDQVMVGSFDQRVEFLTGFTSDRPALERAIRSTVTGNGTSVYDAVYLAVAQKLRNIDGRKALILFSDGEDTTSRRASYEDAIDIVTESDVLVYGLRYPASGGGIRTRPRDPFPGMDLPFPIPMPFPWPRRRRRGNFSDALLNTTVSSVSSAVQRRRGWGGGSDFMTDVTTAGGGPVYDADAIGDLSRLARRIAEELRHVYMISYYPTNPISNGGFRSIRVRVNRGGDLAVRHRRGYHARDVNSGNTD
jgi:VWFA-related protein